VGLEDFQMNGPSREAGRQVAHVMNRLPEWLQRCKLPRCMPFEPEHSDGLHTGATLSFLKKKKFMAEKGLVRPAVVVGINDLVAVTPKLSDGCTLVVHLASTSSLSGVDYLRFSLLCDASLHAAVKLLVLEGKANVAALKRQCNESSVGDLIALLRVLLHANVLYSEEAVTAAGARAGALATAAPGATPMRLRKKRRTA